MNTRLSFVLMAMFGAASAAIAGDLAPTRAPEASHPVPGARVTIEGGVRVIRPASIESGPGALEQAEKSGSLVYRGAAFYRVPSGALPKNDQTDADKAPSKPSAQ